MNESIPSFKVIILGETEVGKSTLLYKYKNGCFPSRMLKTTTKTDITAPILDVEGKFIKLEIWDPAGQEKLRRSVMPLLYRNAKAVIFIYDITDRKSFRCLNDWIEECKEHDMNMKYFPVVLLANKCDLRNEADKTQVTTEEGKKYAKEHNMMYYETSAHSINCVKQIEDVFLYIARIFKFASPDLAKDTIKPCKADLEKKASCCDSISNFFKWVFGLA